ncbi:ribosome-assembly protein 3-domain-containing protein [Dichotomocladium elegans]|nr:ribosome-assembly protein 3-domain-containing protein [Dichotomocladium elegans]
MSEDDNISDSEEEEEEDEGEERIEEATPGKPSASSSFRDHYMAEVTQAFGSDLDKIRQEPGFNSSQLTLLINSLEAGIDIFSNIEQEIIMQQE